MAFHDSGGSGSPVILLHGWMTDHRVYADVLPLLSPDRRYIAPNLRGTEGAVEDYSIDAYVTDVMNLAEQLSLSSFAVVGHSFGGQLAQHVAARGGERVTRLVLVNPVPTAGLPLPDEMAGHFRGAGGNADALGGILDNVTLALPKDTRERLLAVAVAQAPETVAGCFNTWSGGLPDATVEIGCPTTVVATDDPVLTQDLLRSAVVEKIPGAELVHLPGNGHYPLNESPKETASLLDRLLA